MSAGVPTITEFREYVDTKVPKLRDQILIKMLYLMAARICEVITKASAYDLAHNLSKPYGRQVAVKTIPNFKTKDWNTEPIAVFKIPVAKRKKNPIVKSIALPCDPKYEPWTIDLLRWALKHHTRNLAFPLSRWTVWNIVNKNLKPLLKPMKEAHGKKILNPWRHLRLTHLVDEYGFDSYDLVIYSGWTYRHAFQTAGQLDSYIHLDWRRYIEKLLVPCKYQKPDAKEVVVA